MTAVTPAVSAAGTYYIQVEVFNVYSTQTNVSVPSNLFTYSVQAPLIVSLSPQSGTTGTTLTIAGANFLTGSTVGFCPVAKYDFTSFACTVTPTAGAVPSNPPVTATQITVSVPTLATGNYYPIVTLPSTYNTIPASQPYNSPRTPSRTPKMERIGQALDPALTGESLPTVDHRCPIVVSGWPFLSENFRRRQNAPN